MSSEHQTRPSSGRHAAIRAEAAAVEPVRTSAPEHLRPGLYARLRYRLDLALSRGALIVIVYLTLVVLAIVVLAAAVLTALHLTGVNGGPRLGFVEAFW